MSSMNCTDFFITAQLAGSVVVLPPPPKHWVAPCAAPWTVLESPFQQFIATHRWSAFRFFVIPFCVSSYSALANTHTESFVLIFPSDSNGGTVGIAASLFVGVTVALNVLRVVVTRRQERQGMSSTLTSRNSYSSSGCGSVDSMEQRLTATL